MSMRQIENMTLDEKIGQLFVAGFPDKELSKEFLELIEQQKIGNVILFSHNIEDKVQMAELNQTLIQKIEEETGITPFICIDEEGGVVSRLPRDTAILPSAMAQAAVGKTTWVKDGAKIVGEQLLALGVNFNLAPVLDINSNSANPVIGVRSFGETKQEVCKYAAAAAEGYEEAGILYAGKHFPGHGDTALDSHLSLPQLDRTEAQLEEREIAPFLELIQKGLPAITIAHIKVPSLESEDIPATMSKRIVTDYLRGKLGFRGLIISDCMEMNAIKEYYGISKGVVWGLAAGIDLIFISHTASAVKEATAAVKRALAEGDLSEERLNEAVAHVLKAKEGCVQRKKINAEFAGTRRQLFFMQRFLEKSIVPMKQETFELGEKPLFIGAMPVRVSQVAADISKDWDFAHELQSYFGGEAIAYSKELTKEEKNEILHMASNATSVVIGTLNVHLQQKQIIFWKQLYEQVSAQKKQMAHVALQNPYDLTIINGDIFKLSLYEYSQRTIAIMRRYFA